MFSDRIRSVYLKLSAGIRGTRLFRFLLPGRPMFGAGVLWRKVLAASRSEPERFKERLLLKRDTAKLLDRTVTEEDGEIRLGGHPYAAKVTDCGYDNLVCVCTSLPADSDFVLEAELTVRRFLREPGPSGQEAFGMFIRDTLEKERNTGMFYSNMAAVGGYYGRWNVFGRSGVTPEDIGHISNFVLYPKVNAPGGAFEDDPLRYRIRPEAPCKICLKMTRRGNEITAEMRDPAGRDLLAPEHNGGTDEPARDGGVIPDGAGYKVRCPENVFRSRDQKHLYVGFFAAGKSEISVSKESLRLTLLSPGRQPEKGEQKESVSGHPEDVFPEPLPGWDREDEETAGTVFYASQNGNPKGDGSEGSPLDLPSAVGRCADGETVFLLPGVYSLRDDLVIAPDHSGCPGSRRHLRCGDTEERQAVLDFGGTDHGLRLCGSFWDVENITVTNGRGIMIEGSYNRVRHCESCRNLETGILISHRQNGALRSVWPAYNLVEDCLSYENRDLSECNADGFACKVAAGEGNCFRRCTTWLNADDGFDLFAKNRQTGAVRIEECKSFLNGYKTDENGNLTETAGNGNGFKAGGSGMYVRHQLTDCLAEGNKGFGFTNNYDPYFHLERCQSHNNDRGSIRYDVYAGSEYPRVREIISCGTADRQDFDREKLLRELKQGRQPA